MSESGNEFRQCVGQIVKRFFGQNARPVPADVELARFADQLWQLVLERGLPRPLREGECGTPGGMSEQECAPLVARVSEGCADPLLADAARQLVKACFYPEFTVCRDSFREVARDGACRRQELERARGRISGAHCVDCPHWVALEPIKHARYLAQEWRGRPELLAAQRDIFLPEDFRTLRRWLHAAARRKTLSSS